MGDTPKRLWVPPTIYLNKMRAKTRTIVIDGVRCKVTVDDSGTVTHIERDDSLDAIVRPRTVRAIRLKG